MNNALNEQATTGRAPRDHSSCGHTCGCGGNCGANCACKRRERERLLALSLIERAATYLASPNLTGIRQRTFFAGCLKSPDEATTGQAPHALS